MSSGRTDRPLYVVLSADTAKDLEDSANSWGEDGEYWMSHFSVSQDGGHNGPSSLFNADITFSCVMQRKKNRSGDKP